MGINGEDPRTIWLPGFNRTLRGGGSATSRCIQRRHRPAGYRRGHAEDERLGTVATAQNQPPRTESDLHVRPFRRISKGRETRGSPSNSLHTLSPSPSPPPCPSAPCPRSPHDRPGPTR